MEADPVVNMELGEGDGTLIGEGDGDDIIDTGDGEDLGDPLFLDVCPVGVGLLTFLILPCLKFCSIEKKSLVIK